MLMTEATTRRRVPVIGFRHAPWSPQAWRDTVFVTAGIPVQLAAPVIFAWCWQKASADAASVMSALFVVAPVVALLAGWNVLNRAQRHRCWSLLGVDIPATRAARRIYTPVGFASWISSGTT